MDQRLEAALAQRRLGNPQDPEVIRWLDDIMTRRRRHPPASWQTLAAEAEADVDFDITAEELETFVDQWFDARYDLTN